MSQKNCTDSPQYVNVRAKSNVNLKRVELPEGAQSGKNKKAHGLLSAYTVYFGKDFSIRSSQYECEVGQKATFIFFSALRLAPTDLAFVSLFDLISVPQCS